jgi:hypothetical protein
MSLIYRESIESTLDNLYLGRLRGVVVFLRWSAAVSISMSLSDWRSMARCCCSSSAIFHSRASAALARIDAACVGWND